MGGWLPDHIRWRFASRSHHSRLDAFARRAAASLSEGARVLDAGAGDCRYQKHFRQAIYESADFCQVKKPYGEITYVCDLRALPVEASRYDLVLMTQVLEHLAEPLEVLGELHRVLKPGGTLWLSAPLQHEEHEEPYDFFRYTQFGLRHVLQRAGFQVVELEWTEGYFGTLAYELVLASDHLPLKPRAYGGGLIGVLMGVMAVPLRGLFLGLSALFTWMERRHRHVHAAHCKNYSVVAQKPRPAAAQRP